MIGSFLPIRVTASNDSRASCRLYSPLVLLGYATLTSLFVATALFGVNLRRRGFAFAGTATVLGSVVAWLLWAMLFYGTSSGPPDLRIPALFGTLLLYSSERRSFAAAQRDGARAARWWLPGVILLAVGFGMGAACTILT